jgi:hypothetical protein
MRSDNAPKSLAADCPDCRVSGIVVDRGFHASTLQFGGTREGAGKTAATGSAEVWFAHPTTCTFPVWLTLFLVFATVFPAPDEPIVTSVIHESTAIDQKNPDFSEVAVFCGKSWGFISWNRPPVGQCEVPHPADSPPSRRSPAVRQHGP